MEAWLSLSSRWKYYTCSCVSNVSRWWICLIRYWRWSKRQTGKQTDFLSRSLLSLQVNGGVRQQRGFRLIYFPAVGAQITCNPSKNIRWKEFFVRYSVQRTRTATEWKYHWNSINGTWIRCNTAHHSLTEIHGILTMSINSYCSFSRIVQKNKKAESEFPDQSTFNFVLKDNHYKTLNQKLETNQNFLYFPQGDVEVMPHRQVIRMQHSSPVIPLFSFHKSRHCLTKGNAERIAFVVSNFSFSCTLGSRNNNRVICGWHKNSSFMVMS